MKYYLLYIRIQSNILPLSSFFSQPIKRKLDNDNKRNQFFIFGLLFKVKSEVRQRLISSQSLIFEAFGTKFDQFREENSEFVIYFDDRSHLNISTSSITEFFFGGVAGGGFEKSGVKEYY